MAGASGDDRSLKETPSWAVALLSAAFVITSILIEHGIHYLGEWFQKQKQKAMSEALEKIKSELMLLGFISLLIAVATTPVSKICIPAKAGSMMLPCKQDPDPALLLSHNKGGNNVTGSQQGYCSKHGKVSLISQTGVHQLHIFIFVLAVFHILYSVITMALAQAKMKKWKAWELETTSLEYEFTNDPSRFRLTRQTSFVRRHSGLFTSPGLRWVVAFFRQFFGSVTKIDYLTMRHGFINAHFAPNSKFDFHKYIKRSMEDDFKVVVGISIPLWMFAIIFQLLNVYRWYTLLAISFMPPAILLLVGAKLEIIIMEMAREIQERATIVKGAPVVEPSNKYFWFNRPQLILLLIHFTLFENAFQMAYFLWTWYEFGITSCFHENLLAILAKVSLGIACQILCSYITFPLYALVTQMGSHMKRSIFEEQTARALKKWHKSAKERKKLMRKAGSDVSSVFAIISASSVDSSPPINHLLHKYRQHDQNPIDIGSTFNSINMESIVNSPKANNYCNSETDMSEAQGPNSVLVSSDDQLGAKSPHNAKRGHEEDYYHDFSFSPT